VPGGGGAALNSKPELTYEQALVELDSTLRSLEEGKLSLEEAIAAVARGRDYLQLCERKLEEARQRIETLPVRDESAEEEPPHPATIAELRSHSEAQGQTPQGEIPF
jgi:exodeoxyribonuclease VII small subunit